MDEAERRLPVAVVTGFLGSGKTTLINRLLRHPRMADAAVVVNEFGEIGLDHHLVASSSENIVLLNSGCLCCTVRGDLVDTLRDLVVKRDKGEVPPFSRVVIETTGLADPAPVIQTLMTLPVVRRYRLDSVVTTVDAVNGGATLDAQSEAVKQAAIADRLLITKSDLAAADTVTELRERLRALNPGATLLAVVSGNVDPAELFDRGCFDAQTKTVEVQSWLRAEAYGDTVGHHHHDHRHDGISSFCLVYDQPLEWRTVAAWLDLLAQHRGPNLLRVKGILNIEGRERPIVLNAVQHLFHPPLELDAWPDADRRSKMVFIVRDISRREISDSFDALRDASTRAAVTVP